MLFSIIFTINIGIGSYFLYFHWYSKKKKKLCLCYVWYPHSNNNLMNLPNGKSQTNRDQKSNLLFLQQHNIEEVDSNLIEKLINKLIDLIDKLVCESW